MNTAKNLGAALASSAMAFMLSLSCFQNAVAESGITGRVAGQSQNGKFIGMVPGASIEILKPGGAVVATTTANARGMFQVELPPGRYFYRVKAEGYQDEDAGRGFEVKRSDQKELFHFALTQGENDPDRVPVAIPESTHGVLNGRVVEITPDGVRGVPIAKITLVNQETRQVEEVWAKPRSTARDAFGEFRVTLPAGPWQGSVRAWGYDRFVDPEPIVITVDDSTSRTFKLRKWEPIEEVLANQGIRGEVLIEKAGRTYPPPFAVTLRVHRGPAVVDTQTTEISESEFRFNTLAGSYRVIASAPESEFGKAVSAPVHVFPGRDSSVRLIMPERQTPRSDEELPVIQAEIITPPVDTDTPTQPDPSEIGPEAIIPATELADLEIMVRNRRDKQPLVGAEVLVRQVTDRKASVIRALTDSDGIARLQVRQGKYFVIARMTGFEVVAATPTDAFLRGRLVMNVSAKAINRGTFVLERRRVIVPSGLVIEAEDEKAGVPIVGAAVTVTRALLAPRLLMTDSNGEVSIPEAVRGLYSIRITHPEYMTVSRDIDFDPARPRHHFAMYRKVTYTDRDFTASGAVMFQATTGLGTALIPGAQVTWSGPNRVSDTTDELGGYSVGVLRGTYNVTVTPPAGSVYAGRTFNDILVNSDLTRNFILRRKTDLPPIGPQVQANVFDESSRRPIPGASVRLQRAGSGGATAASGTTSTSGQVALALAEPGSYLANVNAVGYTPRRIELTATAGRVTVLNAAMRRTSEPIIPGGPSLMTVTGWVVTPSTGAVRPTPTPGRSDAFDRGRFQPVADASVQWYFPNEGGLPGAVRLVRTDAKGRFRFEGIREDTYQVTVRASGYASRSVRVNVRDGMRDPVVVLTPQRSIRPTDDPSASKTFVKLTVLTRTQPPQVIPGARLDIKGNRDAASGTSDASGRFTTRLAPGQYTVRASHGKYQSTSQQLTVASSAVNQQVYLTPIGTTPGRQSDERSLTVHVTDQSRSPVAGAIVEVLPQQRGRFGLPAKPLRRGTTSTSGSFRTTMRPGLYTLRVSGRGFQTATGTLGITTSDVVKDIRVLRRSVSPSQDEMSLVVMVVDQTRKGVAGATVTVMRGNQAIKTGTTNTSGRYQTTVPPGSYAIKASGAMINPGGTQATVQNSNVTATVNVTRTSSASSGDSGRTQIKYLAQVRAPGSTTWTTIGTYTNRKLAEAALQRAKMPVKSQTRVVPQRMPVIRGPIQRRVFPTEIRR